MAGIGDYVHYRAQSYRAFSINPGHLASSKNQGKAAAMSVAYLPNAVRAYQDMRELVRAQYAGGIGLPGEREARILQDKLNKTKKSMAEIQKSLEQNNANDDDYTTQVVQNLIQYIESNLPGVTPDIATLTGAIISGEEQDSLRSAVVKYTGLKRDPKDKDKVEAAHNTMRVSTLRTRIEQLANAYRILSTMASSGSYSAKALQRINKHLDEIEKIGNSMVDLFIEIMRDNPDAKTFSTNSSIATIFRDFNKIIRSITAPTSHEAEVIGEAGLAAAAEVAVGTGVSAAADLFDSTLVGKKKQSTAIRLGSGLLSASIDNVSGMEYLQKLLNTDKKNNERTVWTIGGTGKDQVLINSAAGLVDIAVELSDDAKKELGTDTLLASIKNYRSSSSGWFAKGIKIVETSLLEVLMLTTDAFATHYLNLLGTHGRREELSAALIKQYSEGIKFPLVLRGFRGTRTIGDTDAMYANFFILNDSQTGQVTVLSVGHLLTQLEDLNALNQMMIFENIPTDLLSSNKWIKSTGISRYDQNSAAKRIIQYLVALQGIKLKASLTPDFYKNVENIYSTSI